MAAPGTSATWANNRRMAGYDLKAALAAIAARPGCSRPGAVAIAGAPEDAPPPRGGPLGLGREGRLDALHRPAADAQIGRDLQDAAVALRQGGRIDPERTFRSHRIAASRSRTIAHRLFAGRTLRPPRVPIPRSVIAPPPLVGTTIPTKEHLPGFNSTEHGSSPLRGMRTGRSSIKIGDPISGRGDLPKRVRGF